MRRVSGSAADGEEFEGLIPDLLKRAFSMVGAEYRIRLVADGKYGKRLEDGQWNGMIGELTRHVSEISVITDRASDDSLTQSSPVSYTHLTLPTNREV